jgi:hypothetical protein
MAITFSIDQAALSLVLDNEGNRVLGTAFSFIRPNWVVTAKHVAFVDGLPRRQLLISAFKRPSIRASVLFAHPQVDLAVLSVESDLCPRPLFPAHHSLSGGSGLICAGYAPSKSAPGDPAVLYFNEISSFTTEIRDRGVLSEEMIVFDAPFSEGGHSGGPIFGVGGGVVGAIIQNFYLGSLLRARGTSLAPIVSHLTFA